MSMSNFLEAALLNHIRGGTAYTQPSGIYVKLHLGNPGEDCTANPAANTVRQAVTFTAPSGGSMVSTGSPACQWTSVSTTETYTHFSLWDSASAGNALGYGALASPGNMTAGDTFQISTLTWNMD